MAKINLNKGINDISGHINGWVYRSVNGRMAIAPMPKVRNNPPTARQVAQRDAFAAAASYGRSVLANPVLRPIYEQVAREQKKPIFAIAIGDFFTPPRVTIINLTGYHGQVGEKIKVRAGSLTVLHFRQLLPRHSNFCTARGSKPLPSCRIL